MKKSERKKKKDKKKFTKGKEILDDVLDKIEQDEDLKETEAIGLELIKRNIQNPGE
ncbi:MAG: hypothetical protein HZA37_00705 [Parcubacteria group bacterium]|nr:hypothetical protein [Parcubacteria group bacterium]